MPDCVHHWLLESPEGPSIAGKCRDCDATHEWPNKFVEAAGRPMILRDPLLPRTFNNGYAGPRARSDYY
jgi:hypothetical protein